jgi:hypothetical protein
MFTVTLPAPAESCARELVSVNSRMKLMVRVAPAPAAATAATAVFQSFWLAMSMAQASVATRLPAHAAIKANDLHTPRIDVRAAEKPKKT